MEQSTLKRYNEIHVMLWEEVLKVFDCRADKSLEEFKTNTKLLIDFFLPDMKKKAVLNLYSKGYITGSELSNLLANANCSACYIAQQMYYTVNLIEIGSFENRVNSCRCCPITKWRSGISCNDYYVIEELLKDLELYIVNCISGKEKLNTRAYTKLRKRIMKKMYILAHLEWGYEENGK